MRELAEADPSTGSTGMFEGIPNPEPALDRKGRMWVFAGVLLFISVILFVQHAATPTTVPWSIASGKLQIHTKVWSDDFPLSDLQTDQARVVDLNREPGLRPSKKSWGFDGSGYSAGRFVLRNGSSADLYLANENTAVLIPRRGDVPVIIGVNDPRPLLAALQNAAPRSAAQ